MKTTTPSPAEMEARTGRFGDLESWLVHTPGRSNESSRELWWNGDSLASRSTTTRDLT